MYGRSEEKREYDSKEQEAEEVVSENVLPALMDFIACEDFRSEVDRFMGKYAPLFEDMCRNEHKGEEDMVQEWTHEHKDAFDRYQETLEELFSSFAKRQRVSLSDIYKCCQDTGAFSTCNSIYTLYDLN